MAALVVALHISPDDVWALTLHEVQALQNAHNRAHKR